MAWFGLENVLVWSLFFKTYRYATFVHITTAILIALLFTSGALVMLVSGSTALLYAYYWHNDVGFGLLILLPFILTSGAVCKFSQTLPAV